MNPKVICFFAIVAAVYSAPQYPAGVSPALCPGYPICDNLLLASHLPSVGSVPFVPTAPVSIPFVPTVPVHHVPTQIFHGAKVYPPGVNPSLCPNYPYCDIVGAPAHVAPLPGFTERLYPAGVSPASCPNYPEC